MTAVQITVASINVLITKNGGLFYAPLKGENWHSFTIAERFHQLLPTTHSIFGIYRDNH